MRKIVKRLVEEHWDSDWHDSRLIEDEIDWVMKFAHDLVIATLEERLKEKLATKVAISGSNSRGKIMIEYYSQDDLDRLKAMSDRIGNIEKSIASQKRVTNVLRKDISDIKEKLSIIAESGGVSLIPAQTTMELYGASPEKAKSFRIRYTDDINVKFQFQDRTLLVSLDVDSEKVKSKMAVDEYAPISEEGFESETDEYGEIYELSELLSETIKKESFFSKYMIHIIGSIAALILLFAVFSLMKKKVVKKKPPAEEDIEFGEEEEELEEIEEEIEEVKEEGEELQ